MAVDPGVYSIIVRVNNSVGSTDSGSFPWTVVEGGPVEPVWAAAASEQYITAAGRHEFVGQHIGAGAPTFTCDSDLLLPDNDGVDVTIPANTITAHGARLGGGAGGRRTLVDVAGWVITDGGPA